MATKKLALDVFLNGEYIGTCGLCTAKTIHVEDGNKLRSDTLEEAKEKAITTVCFMRHDDLLANNNLSAFSIKSSLV